MATKRIMLNQIYKRLTLCLVLAGVTLMMPGQRALAQDGGDDRLSQPTEYGVRFTPEMARAMARFYVDQVVVRRYELEETKVAEAAEAIAKRLMKLAHQLDSEGYHEPLEEMMADIMEFQIDTQRDGGRRGPTPKFGQAIAKGVLPALPAVREMMRGVSQDVRPMLSVGQQLKFGKDLLLAEATFDTFKQSMQRWSEGQMRQGENPFQSDSDKIEKEADGHSRVYNNAERIAERSVDRGEWTKWEKYVENAKAFYEFDDAQSAVADSILRECLDRVEAATQQERWRGQMQRNRVWFHMLWHLGIGMTHPLRYHIDTQYAQVSDPVIQIGEDFRRRIDEIPTRIQRQIAEERVLEAFEKHGYRETPFVPEEAEETKGDAADQQDQDADGSETGI